MLRRTTLSSLILICMLVAAAVAASLESEIDWISTVPGLSVMTTQSSGTKVERVYTMTGDGSSIMSSIRSGLQKRGWKISNSANVAVPGAAVQALIATRGNLKIDLSLQNGVAALVLTSGGAAVAPSVHVSGGGQAGGAMVTINDNLQTITYDCHDSQVTVNGNSNHITLHGRINGLTVNGNSNAITVDAAVKRIAANGNSNAIQWSARYNPVPPQVTHNGHGDTITSK